MKKKSFFSLSTLFFSSFSLLFFSFFLLRLERAAPPSALPSGPGRPSGQDALSNSFRSPGVGDDHHIVERDRPSRRRQHLQDLVLVGSRLRGGHGAVLQQRRVARRAHLGLEVDRGRLAVVRGVGEAQEVAVGGAVAVARDDDVGRALERRVEVSGDQAGQAALAGRAAEGDRRHDGRDALEREAARARIEDRRLGLDEVRERGVGVGGGGVGLHGSRGRGRGELVARGGGVLGLVCEVEGEAVGGVGGGGE